MGEKLFKFTILLVLRPGVAPNESPEGNILVIDIVFQNRPNTIKNHEI